MEENKPPQVNLNLSASVNLNPARGSDDMIMEQLKTSERNQVRKCPFSFQSSNSGDD